jgi:hypothetical protein
MPGKDLDIFISYSHDDREFANQLAKSLSEQGSSAWMSEHGVLTGSDWLLTLKDKLQESAAMVLVMPTTTAVSGNSAFFEAGAARVIGKDIIVVVPELGNVDRTNIPFDLAKAVVLDANKQPIGTVAATVLSAARKVQ